MLYRYLFCVLTLAVALCGCKSNQPVAETVETPALARMKRMELAASISRSQALDGIPSASGIEYVQNAYYVVGDDSPYLFQLNAQFKQVQKYKLFDAPALAGNRIPKPVKPDLEGIAHFTYGRDEMLLLLGSGASAARNRGYLVNLSEDNAVRELDLTRFYTFLKRVLKIETEGQLNIEGVAFDATYVYLLQRPLGNKANVLFRLDANDFKDFLFRNGDIPPVAVYHFALPAIGQHRTGFSGAFSLDGKLFITASAEDTPNAVDDGEVIGSLIGVIDLNALPFATDPAKPLAVPAVSFLNTNGVAYKGKVESLVVTEVEKDKSYKVVVVTDDDLGGSELLEVELKVKQ